MRKIIKKISKRVHTLKRGFRRDNLKFVFTLFGSFLGFLITNVSLMELEKLMYTRYKMALLLCAVFAFVFLQQIYYKYEYYHGLTDQLRRSDRPLFLICSYISKSKVRRNDQKSNDFTIKEAEIIYDIDVPEPAVFTDDESHVDVSITYNITAENNSHECSKVYHAVLSPRGGDLDAKYRFGTDAWREMQKDSYYENDKNLTLWYGIKPGETIRPSSPFQYSLRFNFKDSFSLLKTNRFLIDPTNYGRNVDEIHIVVRSKGEDLRKIIDVPQITSYFNGINHYDRSAQHGLTEDKHNPDYKTYFTYDDEPEEDFLYVLEIFTKWESETQ